MVYSTQQPAQRRDSRRKIETAELLTIRSLSLESKDPLLI